MRLVCYLRLNMNIGSWNSSWGYLMILITIILFWGSLESLKGAQTQQFMNFRCNQVEAPLAELTFWTKGAPLVVLQGSLKFPNLNTLRDPQSSKNHALPFRLPDPDEDTIRNLGISQSPSTWVETLHGSEHLEQYIPLGFINQEIQFIKEFLLIWLMVEYVSLVTSGTHT